MAIDYAGLLGTAGQAASALLPYTLSGDQIDYLKSTGQQLAGQAEQIGTRSAEEARFTPFTVTTGTGSTQIGAGGELTQQLAETPAAIQQGLMSQALQAVPQTQISPDQLFAQLTEMRRPEEERRRLELESRLRAQGRLGTQTSMFGGTPEALALEKAIQEQQSADLLTSLTQAGALTGQNIQNLTGLLGAAYTPETQALAALTPAAQFANISQAGRQGVSEALYKGGIAGLESQAAASTAAATLEGQRVRALGDTLSNFFGAEAAAGTTSPYQRLLDALGLGGGSASQVVNEAGNTGDIFDQIENSFSNLPTTTGVTQTGSASLFDLDSQLTDAQFFDKYGYFRGEA